MEDVEGMFPMIKRMKTDRESKESEWQTIREGVALWMGVPTDKESIRQRRGDLFLPSQVSPVQKDRRPGNQGVY